MFFYEVIATLEVIEVTEVIDKCFMDYPVASAAMSSTAARTRLSLFDKVSSVFICLLFLLFLSLVHSNQDIDEDSPNGRIDQSDEGGEHGGVVEEVNNIHNYGF